MFQLSVANQVRRLEHLLKRNHLLENGKLIKLDKKYKVSKEDASSIRSIFSFLNKRGEIDAIHPWLGEEDQKKLESSIAKNDLVMINSIFSDLGPEENMPYELYHTFVAQENVLMNHSIQVEGYSHLTQFTCQLDESIPYTSFDSTRTTTSLKGFDLTFRFSKDSQLTIPLVEKFTNLIQYRNQKDSLKMMGIKESSTLKVIN
jgi:hypothetical protein